LFSSRVDLPLPDAAARRDILEKLLAPAISPSLLGEEVVEAKESAIIPPIEDGEGRLQLDCSDGFGLDRLVQSSEVVAIYLQVT
jgi:hypothetical protein